MDGPMSFRRAVELIDKEKIPVSPRSVGDFREKARRGGGGRLYEFNSEQTQKKDLILTIPSWDCGIDIVAFPCLVST